MAPPSGLSAQFGMVDEVTYGTYVAPTRFLEFVSESLKNAIERVESKGLRAGIRVLRSAQWVVGKQKPAGDLEFEVWNKSYGLLLKHMFGGAASSQPNAGPDPTVWDHTFTPGDLSAKSFTCQIGRPDQGATVRPFSYTGCKVAKWELAAKVGELLILKPSIIAQAETTAQSLATASYASSPQLFVFTQGTLSVGGSAIDVTEATIKGDNGLADDRYKLGSAVRKEPLEAALREYTGDITAYFTSLTDYNRFVNGTEAALVLDFVGALISGAFNFELKVTANVRFDGDTPDVGSPAEVMQPLKVKMVDAGSGAISALYRTTDTSP